MNELFFSHEFTSILWIVLFVLLLGRAMVFSMPVAGLALCHWFNQAINHFIAEFLINQQSDFISTDRQAALIGYQLSAWAICGLIMAFVTVTGKEILIKKPINNKSDLKISVGINAIVYGMVCYFLLSGILSFIPSITSILSGGLGFAAAGLGWCYLVINKTRGSNRAILFSSLMFLFPAFTLLLNGFMGYGIAAIFGVAGVVMVNHRPRWVIGLIAPGLLFLGLSLYPSYMLARGDIRLKVWGGAELGERFETTFGGIIENWKWFDPSDVEQMELLNGRLNQNVLVGYSQEYISGGHVPFAEGETIWNGVLALIPRIIWTDKPFSAGSGGMVTRFTGIKFSEGTSVGIGNLMEFYVNFGIYGIFIGFYILGIGVYYLDSLAGEAIQSMNPGLFFIYFVPGQALMNAIGSFVEWGPAFVGSLVLAWIFNRFFLGAASPVQWRQGTGTRDYQNLNLTPSKVSGIRLGSEDMPIGAKVVVS